MASSALLGAKPLNPDDTVIHRALLLISPSELNPNKSLPFGPLRPKDYVYETWAPSLQTGTAFAIFFVILITGARIWARGFYTRSFGIDDGLIIPAALGACFYLSSIIVQTTAGCLGQHQWDCTYSSLNNYFIWAELNTPIFYCTIFTVKLSIACQNRRMTYMAGSKWRIVHWIFIILFTICGPLFTFLEIFKCSPIAPNFNLISLGQMTNPKALKCLNRTATSLAGRITHIVTDVALLSVPIIIVFRLQMAKRRKYRLIAIFAIGGMSTIASIVRNVNIVKDLVDFTWATYLIYVFNILDVTFAVIVASLPALNVLVDPTWHRIRTATGYFSSSTGSEIRASRNRFLHASRTRKPFKSGESVLMNDERAEISHGSATELMNRDSAKNKITVVSDIRVH